MPTAYYVNISSNDGLTGTTNDTFNIIASLITTSNGGTELDTVSSMNDSYTVRVYEDNVLIETTTWGVISTTGYDYTPLSSGTKSIKIEVDYEINGAPPIIDPSNPVY